MNIAHHFREVNGTLNREGKEAELLKCVNKLEIIHKGSDSLRFYTHIKGGCKQRFT